MSNLVLELGMNKRVWRQRRPGVGPSTGPDVRPGARPGTNAKRLLTVLGLLLFMGMFCVFPVSPAQAAKGDESNNSLPDGYVDFTDFAHASEYNDGNTEMYEILYKEGVTGLYVVPDLTSEKEESSKKGFAIEVGKTASYRYSYEDERDTIEFNYSDIKLLLNDETRGFDIEYRGSGRHSIFLGAHVDDEQLRQQLNVERKVIEQKYVLEYGGERTDKNNYVSDAFRLGFELEEEGNPETEFESIVFDIVGVKAGAKAGSGAVPAEPEIDNGQQHVNVTTAAAESAGETGVAVSVAIAVGVIGSLAAAGAAGSGRSGKDESEEEAPSTYRMLVYKDFGNRIRVNQRDQSVYGRMEEIKPSGQVVTRHDLTQQIQIFSGGSPMVVSGCEIAGDYMGALVRAECAGDNPPVAQGMVCFRFTGAGGTFQNNVVFELVGKPYLYFTDRYTGKFCTQVDVLLGDNSAKEMDFKPVSFINPVTEITVVSQRPENVTGSYRQTQAESYALILENHTVWSDAGPFAKPQWDVVDVVATNDVERAEERIIYNAYPPGLTVNTHNNQCIKGGRLVVDTVPSGSSGDASGHIEPVLFQLQLAVEQKMADGAANVSLIPMDQVQVQFGQLRGEDAVAETVTQKFKYKVEPMRHHSFNSRTNPNGIGYGFTPELTLPQSAGEYPVVLPVQANYQGESFQLEIPIQLAGQKLDPMAGWDVEYERLLKLIRCFGLGHSSVEQVRQAVASRSTAELRLTNRAILYEVSQYYTKDSVDYTRTADTMSRLIVGAQIIKAMGDQAFSVLVRVYGGPFWDAILTPFKELLVDLIGEASSVIMFGGSLSWDNLNVGKHVDDLVTGNILAVMRDPANGLRYAGKIVAGYGIYSLVNNYVNNLDDKGNRSFYNAVTGCFKDLSAMTLKVYVSRYMQKFIDDPKLFQQSGRLIDKMLRSLMPALDKLGEKDVLAALVRWQKRLEGVAGAGATVLFNKATGQSSGSGTKPSGVEFFSWGIRIWFTEGGGDIAIDISLSRMADVLWGLLYLGSLGKFDSYLNATHPVAPADPPYDPNVALP